LLSDDEAEQISCKLEIQKSKVTEALKLEDIEGLKNALNDLKSSEVEARRYAAYLQAKVRENILSSMKVHAVRLQANDINHAEFVDIMSPKLDGLIELVTDMSSLTSGDVL